MGENDWKVGACAICHGLFVRNRDVERADGKLYHRSCARKAGIKRRFRGVTFVASRGKWLAYIAGHKFRGPFATDVEAAMAYNEMAEAYFGDAAILNELPPDPPPPDPDEIAARSAEIRDGWSTDDFNARAPHLAAVPVAPVSFVRECDVFNAAEA